MLGQPVSMLIPEVVGFKLHGKLPAGRDGDRSRAHRHRDAAQEEGRRQVRRVLRQRASSSLPPRRSRDDRQHGARVRRDDGLLPRRRRDAQVPAADAAAASSTSRSSRRTRRRRDSSAPTRRPIPSSPTRSSSTSAPSSRASPARAVRRIACRSSSRSRCTATRSTADLEKAGTLAGVAAAEEGDRGQRVAGAVEGADGRRTTRAATQPQHEHGGVPCDVQRPDVHAASRRRRHRGDHELHEHVEPERDARRRPARAERRGEGAQREAVGEDVARAGLEGRHRLLQRRRRARSTSTSSASTSSATAARRASATPARCPTPIAQAIEEGKLVRRQRALGQSQLRGARQSAHALQLPRVAAARRRVRARRPHGPRPHARADRHRQRRPGLPARHLAVAAGGAGRDPAQREAGVLHARSTPTSSRATSTGRALDVPSGETYAWEDDSTYVKNPPYFEGMTMQPPGVKPIAGARALAHARRLDHDRPHLAGGQHPGVESRRASGSSRTACSARTSTRTARVAAITR